MLTSYPFCTSGSQGMNPSVRQGIPMCRNQNLHCQITKCCTSIFNEAPAVPALQKEKQHTLCKSLGKVHGATH